ncbi:hypothetical protein pdam_00017566 [Pocillopora damicornis]|uniref:Uncharacterized protein n=1 Tax=Pocillopora damicornis TaxID=46731 RepID=A0A3M6TRG5_POCDA|nr:hypothetical protein pdam_00017566 [Pocillopora damicornis]
MSATSTITTQIHFTNSSVMDSLNPGRTEAFDKLKLLLTKKMLLNDIKKLSSDAQTSCLKGFHATLNYLAS